MKICFISLIYRKIEGDFWSDYEKVLTLDKILKVVKGTIQIRAQVCIPFRSTNVCRSRVSKSIQLFFALFKKLMWNECKYNLELQRLEIKISFGPVH